MSNSNMEEYNDSYQRGLEGRDDEVIDDLEDQFSQDENSGATSISPHEEELPYDPYLEDDDEFINSEDKVITEDKDLGIVQQSDSVISWTVENLYKENGKVRNQYALRSDPPIFKIENNDGESVEFVITRDLARQLEKVFTDMRKAYYGIDPTLKSNPFSQESFNDKKSGFVNWLSTHKIITALVTLLILFFVIYSFMIRH